MLRASAQTENGPLIVLGLSEGNIERLRADRPIRVDLASFVEGQTGTLLIFYGRTEAEMEAMFREHGLITERTRNVGLEPLAPAVAQLGVAEEMAAAARAFGLGATGRYPEGSTGPSDEGELRIGLAALDGQVVLNFGKAVAWLSMAPSQARAFAEAVRKKSHEAQGK